MQTIDLILLAPIVFGLVRGLMRGFVRELTSIVAVVLAYLAARIGSPDLAQALTAYVTWDISICQVVAWLMLFFAVALGLHLVGKLLSRMLSAISLGWLNHLTGGVFGAVKWLLIVSVVVNAVELLDTRFHFLNPAQKAHSIAYEPVRKVAAIAWDELKPQGNE